MDQAMREVTLTEALARLHVLVHHVLVHEVETTREPIAITRSGRRAAVLMAALDYLGPAGEAPPDFGGPHWADQRGH
ncbi:type II toxin-antitoxin system prevent-host-death family antitoxin [Georgenia subflava]|uniref:Type II toxin-antitoxin system prevent-host-death family antitoxin n=1 Tax=Georgenia subflava TaxID=1622177 RepID=A0A6N7ENB8_9MICO|nr:type II toxin-antitoxin system prevent-host-death family antitoxin [Georgenia subflava]MPV36704.1 type II toxin-antitoxin system prevent-host-death family antitoxin [Georgenia subflava]